MPVRMVESSSPSQDPGTTTGNTLPPPCTFLSVEQSFSGTQNVSSLQKDEAWRVNVRIYDCDLDRGYLCGTMEALNVPVADTPMSSSSEESSMSNCSSWMLEDIEGPLDDDIFSFRPSNHGMEIWKSFRAVVKEQRRKRNAETAEMEIDANLENEDWFSDDDEDELISLRGSDDDTFSHPSWKEGTNMENFVMTVGMKFSDRKQFRDVLRDWSVTNGWELKFQKNERHKITVLCKHGCEWRLHASSIMKTSTFQVKSIRGSHTCARSTNNSEATYKYIGSKIQDLVKDNPNDSLESLKNKIRRDLQIEVNEQKVYRAKKYALKLIRVDINAQYTRLYDYCETVVKYNPRSTMVLKVDRSLNPPVFERMYFCLSGLRDGFLAGCRPIIGLDGCHLKGIYKGQLLCAIGRDGNDNLYPIAIACVEIEKAESWEWFLNLLFRDIGSCEERGWAFISDRQKGLIDVIGRLAPNAEHRFCLRHMYNNFKAKFKGDDLKKLFWKAASTYNVRQHLRVMKEIKRISVKRGKEMTPFEWLDNIPPKHWARCFFPNNTNCDVVVNNISESFNNYILAARKLPITEMFEWIRRKLMTRIQIKREKMEKYEGVICPNIVKKIKKQRFESRHCFPNWAGDDKYEIIHFMENHVVELNMKHCTCGVFQLCGYPCCHAISAISFHRLNVEDYVVDWFKKDMYMRVYNHMIYPVPGMHDYEISSLGAVNPPNIKIRAGRPKTQRIRDGNDRNSNVVSRKGLTHTCAICLEYGHNKRSCKNQPHPNSKFCKVDNHAKEQAPAVEQIPHQPSQIFNVGELRASVNSNSSIAKHPRLKK